MNQDTAYVYKRGPNGFNDPIRKAWVLRFSLTPCHARGDKLPDAMLHQLSLCKNDEARRLILGVSR